MEKNFLVNPLRKPDPSFTDYLSNVNEFTITYVIPLLAFIAVIFVLVFVFSSPEKKVATRKDLVTSLSLLAFAVIFAKFIIPKIPYDYVWVAPVIGISGILFILYFVRKRLA